MSTESSVGSDAPHPRMTPQRQAVRDELDAGQGFRTAQQIHEGLRRAGSTVGLATVYRTLQAMADAGEVDTRRTETEVAYRRCTPGVHHHHLTCRECGRTVEIAGPVVEAWAASIAAQHGFTEVGHFIEITGRCPACSEADLSGAHPAG